MDVSGQRVDLKIRVDGIRVCESESRCSIFKMYESDGGFETKGLEILRA